MMTGQEAVEALPASVRVGPFDFEIRLVSHHEASGRSRWGTCNSIARVIDIQREMPDVHQAINTLLHEVLHAIYWAYGIEDGDKEERVVNHFALALLTLHRDNPWLADWITNVLDMKKEIPR